MTIGTLLTVLGLLSCRATTVSTRDILFLLGFGLYLTFVLGLIASAAEVNAVFKNILKVVHNINDGKGVRP